MEKNDKIPLGIIVLILLFFLLFFLLIFYNINKTTAKERYCNEIGYDNYLYTPYDICQTNEGSSKPA